MKKLLNKKGFTLIELIVVIAILAILALILVPTISNYIEDAWTTRDQANVRALYSQIQLYEASSGSGLSATVPTVAGLQFGDAGTEGCIGFGATEGVIGKGTYVGLGTVTFSCTINGETYSAPDFAKP